MSSTSLRTQANEFIHGDISHLLSHIDSTIYSLEEYDQNTLHAFVPENHRRARLHSQARRLFQKYPNPLNRPNLFGILFGVKDIYSCADSKLPTTAGSRLPTELFDEPQASLVSKLEQAGALVLGKTVTTEFAYYHPSVTRNPHNIGHTPGGSSSGSAASVGAGLCMLSLGTQTNASIIRPASYCGVVGFKPSFGRVPRDGIIPCSPFLDTVGWFGVDVDSIELVASIVVPDWRNRDVTSGTDDGQKPVLGVPIGAYLQQATPKALDAFKQQVIQLQTAGFSVRWISGLFDDIDTINISLHTLLCAGLAETHRSWFVEYGNLYSSATSEAIKHGQSLQEKNISEAICLKDVLSKRLSDAMNRNDINVWICPSNATGTAPQGLQATGNPIMSTPWTYVGWPSINLPVEWDTGTQLPIGLQVIAENNNDELLLKWAAQLKEAFPRIQK